MRLIYTVYSDGKESVYKTDDDGNNPRHLKGEQEPPPGVVRPMSVYIEVNCDDQKKAFEWVQNALKELPRFVPANGKTNGKTNGKRR